MFGGYYQGRRVLVTGHTGFKGAWLSLWLKQLGAAVHGIGLEAPTQPSLYEVIRAGTFDSERVVDIREFAPMSGAVQDLAPDLIFHLAAQPLVRASYTKPLETFAINAVGTAHLLEAVRRAGSPANVIVVTSDKCYENHGWAFAYRENDPLGGHDIYSMSKAAADLVTQAWWRSFFAPDSRLGRVASVRAGNVIGGGDYAVDRLVPDCVRALLAGEEIPVRHPDSTRPWQHVLDCLSGYLWLGARLADTPKDSPLIGAFNFGPGSQSNLPVRCLVEGLLEVLPGRWRHAVTSDAPHEALRLDLAIDKAAALLRWFPTWDFNQAVRETALWYEARHFRPERDMTRFSLGQIERFVQIARQRGRSWAVGDRA